MHPSLHSASKNHFEFVSYTKPWLKQRVLDDTTAEKWEKKNRPVNSNRVWWVYTELPGLLRRTGSFKRDAF